MNNANNLYGVWRRVTSSILLIVFGFQFTLPVYAATQLLTDEQIKADFKSAPQFVLIPDTSYEYRLAEHVTASKPASFVSMIEFFELLKQQHPSALNSVRLMIPISVGDITTIIPIYPISQQIGDEFIQARYIRNQVTNQLNRLLIDGTNLATNTEGKQSFVLYNNALEYAKSSGKKFGERLTESDYPVADIIWPEYRNINNKRILVPILYLTQATIDARKVRGNNVEKVSGLSKYNSVTLNAGTLKTYRDHTILVAENFVNRSVIEAKGDLSIIADIFENLSGQISSAGSIKIAANDIKHKTVIYQYQTPHGVSSHAGKIASITAAGDIKLFSNVDITVEGATVGAGRSILFNAQNNIYLTSVELTSSSSGTQSGYDYQSSIVTHITSQITATDLIFLLASGSIEITASELYSDQGYIQILAGMGIYIGNEFNEFSSNRSGKVGKVTLQESEFQTIAIRSALDAGRGVIIASDFGDVTLKATQIKSADGAQINALNGKVNMLLAKEQDHYFMNRVSKGTWTIKTETQTDNVDTAVYNGIIGGVKVQATHGLTVEFAQEEGVTLQDTLDMFSGTEDLAWMAAAYNDPAYAGNIEVVYQELLNLHEYDKSRRLSPAAMAIIAIAMAVAMGPAGFGAIGGTGAGTIGTGAIGSSIVSIGIPAASLQAGALAIATQAATSLASGNNLGETLKSLTAKGNITSLATAMVTAGVLSEIGDYGSDFFGSVDPNAPLLSADTLTSIGNQATQAVIHSSVSAGISTVIHGGDFSDFGDSFKANLKQAGINAVGQYLASSIGKSFKDGDINNIVRYLAHAGAGCVIGLAANAAGTTASEGGESCMTGAGGAVVGELVADAYKAKKLNDLFNEQQNLVDELTNAGASKAQIEAIFLSDAAGSYYNTKVAELTAAGVDLAKLAGGLSALIAESDVNLGAMTAENAAKNNAFFLIPIALMILKAIDIALTANELHDIYQEMQTNPASGNKMLVDWLEDQAMGGLISKAIPGFKSMEDLLDWLRRNDVLAPDAISKIQQQISHKKSTDLGQATPDNRIEVYNASTNKLDLNTFQGDEFIGAVDLSHLPKGKRVNDGFLGEIVAKDIFENATGLPFKELIKNGANNGADLFAIDAKSSTIWLVEVKSSIRDSFPDPNKLDLENRGWRWIEAAAGSGKIAGKTVEPEGIAYARTLLKLRDEGYVIKPMLAKVSVPAAGSSGVARVTITAAK